MNPNTTEGRHDQSHELQQSADGDVDDSPCPADDLLRITVEALDDEDWSEFDQPPVGYEV